MILDLTVVNGMGGVEAARGILEIDPAANLLVASGYSNDRVMSTPGKYSFKAVLSKPYTLDELNLILNRLTKR